MKTKEQKEQIEKKVVGDTRCPNCYGNGTQTCPTCGGSGRRPPMPGYNPPGTGFTICPGCAGRGSVTCRTCGGKGTL